MAVFLKGESIADIGKIHVVGSENPYQIGKAFLFDGDTNPVIYSGELVLYDHGVENVGWTAIGTKPSRATKNDTYLRAWTTSAETAGFRTEKAIEIASFSTLKITYTDDVGNGYSGGYFRVATSISNISGISNNAVVGTFKCNSSDGDGIKTISIDLSGYGYTANRYVSWDVSGANAQVNVYKVWLE